jgi:hypothetical protein
MTRRIPPLQLIVPFVGLAAVIATSIAAPKEAQMPSHAQGTFEVMMTPQDQPAAPDGAAPTYRFGLSKVFSGPLTGKALGTMLSMGTPKPGSSAAYVALDQFTGSLEGKSGGFVLVHRGTIAKSGATDLDVRIAPDSGTGELAGIAGSLNIEVRDGKHHYDLTYTLPAAP